MTMTNWLIFIGIIIIGLMAAYISSFNAEEKRLYDRIRELRNENFDLRSGLLALKRDAKGRFTKT